MAVQAPAPNVILQQFAVAAQEVYDGGKKQRLVLSEGDRVLRRSVGGWCTSLFSKKEILRANEEQNRRTWTAFIRALSDVLGEDKVRDIAIRYGLDLERIQAAGKPLLAEDVETFSIGSSLIFTRDIKRLNPDKKLKDRTAEEIATSLEMVNPFHTIVGKKMDPLDVTGVPTTIKAHLFYDPRLMDKEAQALLSNAGRISFDAWQERFCKCLINRELREKQIIPCPGTPPNTTQYYKVYKKISSGNGLICYALTPIGQPPEGASPLRPALYFRPTQMSLCAEDALQTCMDDFSQSIGEAGYRKAKEKLDDLMADPKFCPEGQKIQIGGYSLGGAYAQFFLMDHYTKVRLATFHGDPGLDHELPERFAEEINRLPRLPEGERMEGNIYRTDGDVVHYGGEKHVGWGVTHPDFIFQSREYHAQMTITSALTLHGARIFDSTEEFIEVRPASNNLDRRLNNAERGIAVFWYEHTRKVWGRFFYSMFFITSLFLRCFGKITGKRIVRRTSA